MKFDSYTAQGGKQNEDFVFVNNQVGILLDGASGLYGEKVTDGESDAQWFSHRMGEKLVHSLKNLEKSIPTCVKECCDECLSMYQVFLKEKKKTLEKDLLPSSTISIVRINQDKIECYQLGDSPIFVDTMDGIKIWDDPIIEANDQLALDHVIENRRKNNTSICEEISSAKEILQYNRKKKNTKNGYWILEPLGEGIRYGIHQIYNIEKVKKVAVMSDGFWEIMNIFQQYPSTKEFFQAIFLNSNLEKMIKKLREEQRSDPLFNQYPRLKLMDDATIFYYNFEK